MRCHNSPHVQKRVNVSRQTSRWNRNRWYRLWRCYHAELFGLRCSLLHVSLVPAPVKIGEMLRCGIRLVGEIMRCGNWLRPGSSSHFSSCGLCRRWLFIHQHHPRRLISEHGKALGSRLATAVRCADRWRNNLQKKKKKGIQIVDIHR